MSRTARPVAHHPWHTEVTITTELPDPTLNALREKIRNDTTILNALDPKSSTYRRLQDRIAADTDRLLDGQDALASRRAIPPAARPEAETSAGTYLGGGLVFGFFGYVITDATWFSVWSMLGIFLLLTGLGAIVVGVVEAAATARK